MTETVVTMKHMRQAQFCASGVRAFFAKHGLNWTVFLREGIPATRLEATGDAMAKRVVELARGQ